MSGNNVDGNQDGAGEFMLVRDLEELLSLDLNVHGLESGVGARGQYCPLRTASNKCKATFEDFKPTGNAPPRDFP